VLEAVAGDELVETPERDNPDRMPGIPQAKTKGDAWLHVALRANRKNIDPHSSNREL
jgi:hypothetical protein